MNDEQFGIGIKISIIITCVILLMLGILVTDVLKTKDTSGSILDDVASTTGEAQIEDDEEFKQYLQVMALMVQDEAPTKAKHIATTIGFLNQIFWYETLGLEDGYVCYDQETVKKVAIELLGTSILETSEEIIFDEKYQAYRYAEGGEFIVAECMDILNVSKKDNIYEVEYICTFPGESGAYELSEGNEISLATYKIKAILQKNEKYEYSKYYLKNIELLSKDIVKYN